MKTLIVFIAPKFSKKGAKSFNRNKPLDTDVLIVEDPSVQKLKIKVYCIPDDNNIYGTEK